MTTNNIIEKVKIVLDIEDDSKDGLLDIYIQNAKDYIFDYTLINEIPTTLESVIVEMVVFQYRQRGVENITTESKGTLYESMVTEYPNNIRRRLNSYKRVRVV